MTNPEPIINLWCNHPEFTTSGDLIGRCELRPNHFGPHFINGQNFPNANSGLPPKTEPND